MRAQICSACAVSASPKNDQEFVAAQAGEQVVFADALPDAVCYSVDQRITRLVPERVVDLLKSVIVEEANAERFALQDRFIAHRVQPRKPSAAVENTGHHVKFREKANPLCFGLLSRKQLRQCNGKKHDAKEEIPVFF